MGLFSEKVLQKISSKWKGPMTEERIKLLDSIGFNWNKNDTVKEVQWMETFNQVKAMKEANEDINGQHHKWSPWISTQRLRYQQFQRENGKGPMTKERIKLLESIGINWNPGLSREGKDVRWMERFEQLKEFKKLHGHMNAVRKKTDTDHTLAIWVVHQRSKYRRGILRHDRMKHLDSIGFTWVDPGKTKG